jgi:hypothetical protein
MIQFINNVDTHKLRMAYNNDVLRFFSNSPGIPKYADIMLKSSSPAGGTETILFNVRLYPNPNGEFYINLQPYAAAAINTGNFEDLLDTSAIAGIPDSFLYEYTKDTLLAGTLFISVTHNDTTVESTNFELTWLAGMQQQGHYYRIDRESLLLLSPPKENSLIEWYLKYWQGYPFDISLYTPFDARLELKIENETNRHNQSFKPNGLVSRLLFCDGRTDETLDSVLPLTEGVNKLKFDLRSPRWVIIEKLPYRCGVYLKWFNAFGGYSYWLFENTFSVDRNSKDLGSIDANNANIENSFGPTISLGRESQDTIKIITELLNRNESRIVEGLLESPKIYMFTGKPFAINNTRDWIEVSLRTTATRVRNPKEALTNFAFDILLPQRFSQKL